LPIVVDSNIIFASLIKKSTTRMILASTDIDFIVPEWVHSELREHIGELAGKAGVPEEEMERFIDEIFQIVHTVPLDEYKSFLVEALEIMSEIDPDDAPFLAGGGRRCHMDERRALPGTGTGSRSCPRGI